MKFQFIISRKEMDVIKKKICLPLCSLLLFILGLLFGVPFGNKPAFGDIILKFIGLNSWSNNNNTGLHYTSIISLIFITLSVILTYRFLKIIETKNINGKNRIDTWEFKLSILSAIISSFLFPGKIVQDEYLIEYAFGFPCNYWSIYQDSKGSFQLFNNLFHGNMGMNINILGLFVNIIIIYYVVILLKNIFMRVR